ncbi:MAG: hypothetical protein ABIV39_08705 [Verrucomicrobiota bacterium]
MKIGKVLKGLPHNYFNEKKFVHELWNSSNISIHGYRFYKTPLESNKEFESVLYSLMTDQKSFTPYLGPKLCGGYHADFAVQFDDFWYLVCLGCHEVLLFQKCSVDL